MQHRHVPSRGVAYPTHTRINALLLACDGASVGERARMAGCHTNTVRNWVRRFMVEGTVLPRPRGHRGKKLTCNAAYVNECEALSLMSE